MCALIPVLANGQIISLSHQILQFDTVTVNTKDSLSFRIRNNTGTTVLITDINTTRPEFFVKDTSLNIPSGDSVQVFVYFRTSQNLTWKDVLLVESTSLRGSLALRLIGTGKYTGTTYNSTQGLWDNALKTALHNIVNNHASLGYNAARDRMFETIDDPNAVDTIECVYTGKKIKAVNRTEAQNQNFNTEHTWPQGTFNQSEPMRSDLNHLFPTDEPANSARGSYPFGPVVSGITWQSGGSKLGQNPNGVTAFEPRDTHKGDVARGLFYFMLRYENNYESYLDLAQEGYLRQWTVSDAVSAKESNRNTAIANYQGKRNPLVDHPEFIDRIATFRSSTPPTLYPEIATSPAQISFGTIAAGDSVEWIYTVINTGRASLSVSSFALQTPSTIFKIIDLPGTVPIDSFKQVRIRFVPTQSSQSYNNTLVVQNNDQNEGTISVPLTGSTTSGAPQTTLIVPANGATGVQTPVPFSWYKTAAADLYHIQVSLTGGFSSFISNDSTLTDSTTSATGLSLNTTYYWRVRAHRTGGWDAFSATRSFTTWTTPPQVALVSPPDGSGNTSLPMMFTWQSSATATFYQLDVSTSPGFSTFVVVDSTLTGTSTSVGGLALNTVHYWRVRARNGAGWGPYSPTRSFTTWTTPAQVQALIPTDEASQVAVPTVFRWNRPPGATQFQMDLSLSSGFETLVSSDSTISDTNAVASGLALGTTYFWRVRGQNGAGWGSYSSTQEFATWNVPSPIPGLSPADSSEDVAIPVQFIWQHSLLATTYHLEISTTQGFGTVVVSDSTIADTMSSVPSLQVNMDYFWRVRAGNGAGWSSVSAVMMVRTWNAPGQVQLYSPLDETRGTQDNPLLVWNTVENAVQFQIQVSTNPSFATLVFSDSLITDTSATINGLDTMTTYFWRVRGRNNAGWGAYSESWRFRIAAAYVVSVQTSHGWNMISLPVLPADVIAAVVFPTAVSAAFAYSNGYVQRESLQVGTGYWMNFGTPQEISVAGEPVEVDTIVVQAGWNLVGSISYSVPVSSITTIPSGILASPFYEFNNGYTPSSFVNPLESYWVKCSQQGMMILQRSPE